MTVRCTGIPRRLEAQRSTLWTSEEGRYSAYHVHLQPIGEGDETRYRRHWQSSRNTNLEDSSRLFTQMIVSKLLLNPRVETSHTWVGTTHSPEARVLQAFAP
jgi:hypothetical protein